MKVKICGIATENSLCCWSFKNLNDIIHTNHLCCWSYKNLNGFSLYWIISHEFIIATQGATLIKHSSSDYTYVCVIWPASVIIVKGRECDHDRAFYRSYFRPVINSEIWTSRLARSLLSDELLWDGL